MNLKGKKKEELKEIIDDLEEELNDIKEEIKMTILDCNIKKHCSCHEAGDLEELVMLIDMHHDLIDNLEEENNNLSSRVDELEQEINQD